MLETRPAPAQPDSFAVTAARLKARRKQRRRLTDMLAYAVLIVIALIMLYPFYWTLITSFEPTGNIYEAKILPKAVGLRNYAEMWKGTTVPFWRLILNSLIICTLGVTLTVTLATLAAYPLAKMRFPGRDLIFYAILALMVLPNESGLIVNYITTIKLGLLQQTNPVIDAIRQYGGGAARAGEHRGPVPAAAGVPGHSAGADRGRPHRRGLRADHLAAHHAAAGDAHHRGVRHSGIRGVLELVPVGADHAARQEPAAAVGGVAGTQRNIQHQQPRGDGGRGDHDHSHPDRLRLRAEVLHEGVGGGGERVKRVYGFRRPSRGMNT